MGTPSFIVHRDSKLLIRQFATELKRRQELILKDIEDLYPKPDDFGMLPDRVKDHRL